SVFDFISGDESKGNMENIAQFTKGQFTYTTIAKVEYQGEKISSTKIRRDMENGNIQAVNTLLGRPFRTSGTVIEGDTRGHTIGYPTANIDVHEDTILQTPGVYAVKVKIDDHLYEGMANLGFRLTCYTNQFEPNLEVHLLDFNDNIYGA